MFERFESNYSQDAALPRPLGGVEINDPNDPLLEDFFLRYGGVSFNKGLYRVMTTETMGLAHLFVSDAFPSFSERDRVFAYDWLGRIFALDLMRLEGGLPLVLLFDPSAGEVLEISSNLATFHDSELVDHGEEALAVTFHKQWLAKGGLVPNQNQCIEYKSPLFLGGKDTIENLDLSDLDVYWTLSGQLIRKTRGLPLGTQIKGIGISE